MLYGRSAEVPLRYRTLAPVAHREGRPSVLDCGGPLPLSKNGGGFCSVRHGLCTLEGPHPSPLRQGASRILHFP